MIMFAVVSSRIFDWPWSRNVIVRRHVQAGEHLADVVRRLVERVAWRDVGVSMTVNCRFDRCSALGPSPRSTRAMLSIRTGPVADGTVSRPICSASRR